MRAPDRSRPSALQVVDLARLLVAHRVAPSVSSFYLRALAVAVRNRDKRALRSSTRAYELTRLLRLAGDRRVVVEIGTSVAWTSAALALAQPGRRVISIDPVVPPQRERYLALLDGTTRAQLELVEGRGVDGPSALGQAGAPPVELLYLDGRHTCDANLAAFEAWRPALAPRAMVAFHDYGDPKFPGVAEAVSQLGLQGQVEGTLFSSSL